jgi:hypothetical protein
MHNVKQSKQMEINVLFYGYNDDTSKANRQ